MKTIEMKEVSEEISFLKRILPFVIIIFIWWVLTSVFKIIPAYVLSSPGAVIKNAFKLIKEGILLNAIFSSLGRMVGGLLVGTVTGIVLGVLVGTNKYVTYFVEPLAKFFQAVAGPTWIPLAILWFGMSWSAVVFIVFNTVFFIVFYNTLMGIETVNQRLVDSIYTLGGKKWDVLKEVLIPGAVPSIIIGIRLGIGYGWRSLIAGEIIADGQGLGVLIWEGQRLFRIYDIILGLILIGIVSYFMDKVIMRTLEKNTIQKWRMITNDL